MIGRLRGSVHRIQNHTADYGSSSRDKRAFLMKAVSRFAHETVRYWGNRFGPMFAADIRRQPVRNMRDFRQQMLALTATEVLLDD